MEEYVREGHNQVHVLGQWDQEHEGRNSKHVHPVGRNNKYGAW